ncbi:hypothetical protein V2J09_004367 [Rumex salicifolius]
MSLIYLLKLEWARWSIMRRTLKQLCWMTLLPIIQEKASIWVFEDSCPTYMFKAEDCLKKEKERVANYLHSSSEQKLLEVEDLSRMYRLYQKVPKGLEPIGTIFKQLFSNGMRESDQWHMMFEDYLVCRILKAVLVTMHVR